jgi:hypothetical protein
MWMVVAHTQQDQNTITMGISPTCESLNKTVKTLLERFGTNRKYHLWPQVAAKQQDQQKVLATAVATGQS